MGKGGEFERQICKDLSRWWTYNKYDDVLWRSSNSGGRATVRRRKGQRTTGHCGDIASTDPISRSLTQLITFEVKRGYNKHTAHCLLDYPLYAKRKQPVQTYDAWITQASVAAANAGTPFWCIIHRRDKWHATIFTSMDLVNELDRIGCLVDKIPALMVKSRNPNCRFLVGFRLDHFLEMVSPQDIRILAHKWRTSRGPKHSRH